MSKRKLSKKTPDPKPNLEERLCRLTDCFILFNGHYFMGGIYLTPPTPICSILLYDRRLSENADRIRTEVQWWCSVSGIFGFFTMAERVYLSRLRRASRANDRTGSLALPSVPARDISYCWDNLSGQQVAAGSMVPCNMAGHQPKKRYECFGFTAGIGVG